MGKIRCKIDVNIQIIWRFWQKKSIVWGTIYS